jgi:outer membrane protein assembly factor BamB
VSVSPHPGGRLRAAVRRRWLWGVVLGALLAVIAVGLASFRTASRAPGARFAGAGFPNGNVSNTRYEGGPINAATVRGLELAWTLPLTATSPYGSYSSSPIVAAGVVYSQDLASNVQAIDLQTGKPLWAKSYNAPDQGPNGLVVAAGRVYGATPTAAFALDQRTGKQLWLVPLARNAHEGIDMAPGYHGGMVYVSTVPGNAANFYEGDAAGILWALDARTGRKLWRFDTAPTDLWSAAHARINSGGGLWYTPAFDGEGSMYIGVANPAPFPGSDAYPWGSSRPGPDLYTDSIVKLDARTGRLQWYYQLTPHDLYDWDLQDPPILVNVGGRRVVLTAGKGGIVLALDAATGGPIWKRAVGIHNGHDRDSRLALRGEYSRLRLPETVYPGTLGGVIAPMATNGSSVFVPIVNHPVTIATQTIKRETGPSTGELAALDVASGAVRWTHRFASPAFGAVTAVNDLVFATTFDGALYALNASTGKVIWQSRLSAGTNTGVVVAGASLLAPAGAATANGQEPELEALRLPRAATGR